ncbi:TPA: hypothetical protein EYP70_04075 [Candidatus Bathyarchaeota archaeon]|nr:hypothetical protein [Candidatus Bathyarchaeota archaeon]
MRTSKVLAIQSLVVFLALGLIGVWVQSTKGGNVTNCRGYLVICSLPPGEPDPCDAECSGIWPYKWCPDKEVSGGDGYCYDAGSYTGYNCYEQILQNSKKKVRRCDCEDDSCQQIGDVYWTGDLKCPYLEATSC